MNRCFEIETTPDSVGLWLDTRLPFEPRGELIDARNALRDALRTLTKSPGKILSATYHSQDQSFCDVENVLFYNVGAAAFQGLTRNGLRFARNAAAIPSPSGINYSHHHSYDLVSPSSEAKSTRDIGCSLTFALGPLSSMSKPHQVWWSAGQAVVQSSESLRGPFELVITVFHPHPARDIANYLKPFLDGLISALHSESSLDSESVRRLAELTGWDSNEIQKRLVSPAAPILGPRRLLQSYRDFVKWNPADDLCTRCTITTREAPQWSCFVEVSRC